MPAPSAELQLTPPRSRVEAVAVQALRAVAASPFGYSPRSGMCLTCRAASGHREGCPVGVAEEALVVIEALRGAGG